ncbi:Self-incompatibility protein [Parasponia andersonii]|uniref:S-protein homolog n=1 Tax=Parasponia andersonii TaxID=3476 RepID=A0A2P5CRU3_PARAD|nr:Self-incompatibility protein [Parasponia andersonii]
MTTFSPSPPPPRLGLAVIPFLVFMLFSTLSQTCEGRTGDFPVPDPPEERHNEVAIINGLGSNQVLNVHCKSKNDDLGLRVLSTNSNFSFTFHRNFWGTTLFFCSFQWGSQFHWYDVYTPNGPDCRTPNPCWYSVIPNGTICLLNHPTENDSTCLPWNQS